MHKSKMKYLVITIDKIVEACLEMVAVNGRTFSLMDGSGFRKIINHILRSMARPPTSAGSIQNKRRTQQKKTRQMIKDELARRFI